MYILRSLSTARYYVGHTQDLPKRVQEHNNGRTLSTRGRGPWEIFHLHFLNEAYIPKRSNYSDLMLEANSEDVVVP